MKSYISKQVECRTIDNNRKSMQKVSVASNSIIQFAPRVIMTEDDIKKLSLEQLSFFVSQSIRKELYGITMPWKDEIDFNYNNVQLINALKRIHSLNTVGENIVLYENMVGVTFGKNIIYPGLDSCLGITIIRMRLQEPPLKKGAHLVIPFDIIGMKKYKELVDELYLFYCNENTVISISCKEQGCINDHIMSIQQFAVPGLDTDKVVEKLKIFKRKAIVNTNPTSTSANEQYYANTIHTV